MDAAEKAILIERDGELNEIAALLDSLAVPGERWTGPLPGPESFEGARLVIVAAPRLRASGTPNLQGWPRTIAVAQDSSRTLAAHLGRLGVSLVMRPPIHPRTLRLLLLHSGSEEDRLVVIAEVLRDDAEEGMALSFRRLGASQRARIEEIIAETGGPHAGADPLAPDDEPTTDAIVVGEVLESSGPLGTAPEGAAHAAQ
jgi:hypothetical protein